MVEVKEVKVEVRVVRMKIHLVKVSFSGGYHLVCGGRLVLERRDGKPTPHPELPEYTYSDFPVDINKWIDGKRPDVVVTVGDRKKPLGPCRACTMLFTPCDACAVSAWLKKGGAE